MSDNFTMADVTNVLSMPTLADAKKAMKGIIENCSEQNSLQPMNPRKRAFLLHQIDTRHTVKEVGMIGVNMFLVGEGLGMKNSKYQKLFKNRA